MGRRRPLGLTSRGLERPILLDGYLGEVVRVRARDREWHDRYGRAINQAAEAVTSRMISSLQEEVAVGARQVGVEMGLDPDHLEDEEGWILQLALPQVSQRLSELLQQRL
jgi:hypothetical protein